MNYRPLLLTAIIIGVIAIPFLTRDGSGRGSFVELASPDMRPIRTSVLASGSLAHENEVTLTAEVIGRVTGVYVEEGETVAAKQLVLRIDDEALAAQVAQSEASVRVQEIDIERAQLRVENLRRRWQRTQKLYEQELIDERSFEDAEHDFRVAEVDLRSARERLVQTQAALQQFQDQQNKTRVRAPIDGVVTSLDIELGETAISSTTNIPGSGLMTIADPSNIMTEVYVDEADVADIQLGQPAEIVAIAYPEQPLQGEVQFIANTAKHETHRQGLSFLVRIAITDTNGIKLRPGMSCRAAIFTGGQDEVLSVPVQAVVVEQDITTREQEEYVFVMREGRARKVPVETGLSDDAFQEILSGLEVLDDIITGPARTLRRLRDGDLVQPEIR
ncbi:MAG: efflux RND transporter periplasmic adaptor subunit [Pseudomonadota bacterium]